MRRVASPLLIALCLLLTFIALLATWVRQQALDTDSWVDTSTEILSHESVQRATAGYLADQVTSERAQSRLESVLPERAKPLAVPIQGLAADAAESTAMRALKNDRFQRFWERSNRIAHQQLVRAIDSDADRAIVLDLRPMLGRIAARTGFNINDIPPESGVVRILDGDELGQVRGYAKLLRGTAWWAAALALLALAAAIALAPDRRRAVVRAGIGLFAVALLVLIARRVGINQATSALGSGGNELAVRDTLTTASTLLMDMGRSVAALGLLMTLAAWAVGPGAWATKLRGAVTPPIESFPGIAHLLAFSVVLLLVFGSVLPWSSSPLAIVVYAIAGATFVEVLRRAAPANPA